MVLSRLDYYVKQNVPTISQTHLLLVLSKFKKYIELTMNYKLCMYILICGGNKIHEHSK